MNETEAKLQERIEAAYAASGNRLGWRFLYSPAAVLERANLAFWPAAGSVDGRLR